MNPGHMGCPAVVLDASGLVHAILKRNSDTFSFLWERQYYCFVINWLEFRFLVEDVYEEE